MRRKNLGFTVSELVIAIGIIGVVAALTIPMLNNYLEKKQTELNLAKAVAQIELGCQNIIQRANDNSQDGTIYDSLEVITIGDILGNSMTNLITDEDFLFDRGKTFLGVNDIDGDEYQKYIDESRDFSSELYKIAKEISSTSNSPYVFEKFKTIVYYPDKAPEKLAEEDDPIFRKVYIDVNGMSKPNQPGIDLFLFGLTHKGKMIPAGSLKAKSSLIEGLKDVEEPDTLTCSGYSCTSKIVQDGFRVTYY